MDYRLFKNHYIDRRTGQKREGETWNIGFRDHLARRQSLAASPREREAHALAGFVGDLVRCRQSGEPLPEKLRKWLDIQSDRLRERLTAMDLIDKRMVDAGRTLLAHLDGHFDAEGKLTEPGFKQALEARGNTGVHVKLTTDRVRKILDGCGFFQWKDINAPGAATKVEVFLADLRAQGDISGVTFNYYLRDLRSFCRWLARNGKAPAVALATLEPLKNAEADKVIRRPLSVDEMHWLIAAAVDGGARQQMTGDERAMLYRFSFETGMRPGQIRALVVKDFSLAGDSPTVTTQARHVKRRQVHTQALRPALAAELRKLFKTKLPDAPALKMPSKYHLADMLRADLASARAKWIAEAQGDQEREERQRSDFLASVNHSGEVACFYSMRHGHGTALAAAGVPMKDIQASMHHTTSRTTEKYLHANRQSVAKAIGSMPDLIIPQKAVATGTSGAESTPDESCPCSAHATGTSPMDSGGQTGRAEIVSGAAVSVGESTKNTDIDGKTGNDRAWRNGRRYGLKIR